MLKITQKEIAGLTKGRLVSAHPDSGVRSVSIDTRTMKRGDCFIAIKGSAHDGHKFISTAIRAGAALLIVSKKIKPPKGTAVLYVQNTTKALGDIAHHHRLQFDIPVIAITGSTGKTTTKELTAKVLSKKYNVLKNDRSENNHIGVPLTLLKLRPSHQIALLELGTNQPGDIKGLSRIVRPTGIILTNIGPSHLQKLKTPSGVFREKTGILSHLSARSPVIYNADDPFLAKLKSKYRSLRFISYGIEKKADLRAQPKEASRRNRQVFVVNGHYHFQLKTPVYENIYNALAAISCGRMFGISYNNMIDAIGSVSLPKGRQNVLRFGQTWVIDDSYNANPLSFKSAVRTLQKLSHAGKKIVVCADMLELGHQRVKYHQETGQMISKAGIDYLLATGPMGRVMARSAIRNGDELKSYYFKSLGQLHSRLKGLIEPGDAVLIKASRSMHLERTVGYLRQLYSER